MSIHTATQKSDRWGPTTVVADVRQLLHPGERPRFWIALATTTLVAGLILVVAIRLGGWSIVGSGAGVVVLASVGFWIGLQLHRARLLGRCVRVTDRSLPSLARVISDQRHRLGFSKRVDFYVADDVDGLISYTSYLGTKIVIIKGDLVADLDDDGRRVQSVFLVGSVLGHFAAKHLRFTPLLVAISALTKTKIFNLLLSPYFRATRYSGDNIGLFLCGSPRDGVQVMHRMLVGKELSPTLNATGVLDQASEVRRRLLPRLTALFRNEPNLTDRYLNVLNYLDYQFPAEAHHWRQELDPTTSDAVASQLTRSPYRGRHHGNAWAALTAASAAVVIATAVLALPHRGSGNPSTQSTPVQPTAATTSVGPETTPAEAPSPTTPTPPLHEQVGPEFDEPTAAATTTALNTYFEGINTGNYAAAYAVLSPRRQAAISYQYFADGDMTSHDSQIQVLEAHRVDATTVDIALSFVSVQRADKGPNGDTCDVWTLDYTMISTNDGSWHIDATHPYGGSDHSAC
jgi:hypothetical protein